MGSITETLPFARPPVSALAPRPPPPNQPPSEPTRRRGITRRMENARIPNAPHRLMGARGIRRTSRLRRRAIRDGRASPPLRPRAARFSPTRDRAASPPPCTRASSRQSRIRAPSEATRRRALRAPFIVADGKAPPNPRGPKWAHYPIATIPQPARRAYDQSTARAKTSGTAHSPSAACAPNGTRAFAQAPHSACARRAEARGAESAEDKEQGRKT